MAEVPVELEEVSVVRVGARLSVEVALVGVVKVVESMVLSVTQVKT